MEINSTAQTFDLDLSFDQTKKKRIRIDEDDNRILFLDTSDLSVLIRLKEIYPKINELTTNVSSKKLDEDEATDDTISDALKDMDIELRSLIDYVFDANVSDTCAPNGTMFDMYNGQFRFEIIIEALTKLYSNNVTMEYRKMKSRVQRKVNKYIGK